MTDPEELIGVAYPAAGHGRRYRIGWESGDVFDVDVDYRGVTLTIEATSIDDAKWMLARLTGGRNG